jgi:hypothetical protein
MVNIIWGPVVAMTLDDNDDPGRRRRCSLMKLLLSSAGKECNCFLANYNPARANRFNHVATECHSLILMITIIKSQSILTLFYKVA